MIKNIYVQLIFIGFIAQLITGCGGSVAIKKIDDLQIENLKIENSKPIQFSKIVIKLKRGEYIGSLQGGIFFCRHVQDLTWKGGRLTIGNDEFTDIFKEELEKYDFKIVGDTNALFDDPNTWRSEILIAGLVKEIKANICYPMAGFNDFVDSSGEVYIKVEWQIYSKLDRSVVHSVITEGSSSNSVSSPGGDMSTTLNAFSQATRHLLADQKFREIISRGGEVVKESAVFSGDQIKISINKSLPIDSKTSDWPSAVVTIFAGSGHGSGFVIADNLILTNYHVAGNAEKVRIRLDNGTEFIGHVIRGNSSRDVALIKVDASLPKYFKLHTGILALGTEVYAIGSPLHETFSSTIAKGIVSAIRSEKKLNYIQSDVHIIGGNSGGPLVNKDGYVVGIAVSGIVINNIPQGINFFIPIAEAIQALNLKM